MQVFHCWQCGEPLTGMILPVSRREECAGCGAEIHVCRMCVHYDPRVADQCREERAEQVTNKELANFCDYYAPNPDPHRPGKADATDEARRQLDALFGGGEPGEPSTSSSGVPKELEDLFRKD